MFRIMAGRILGRGWTRTDPDGTLFGSFRNSVSRFDSRSFRCDCADRVLVPAAFALFSKLFFSFSSLPCLFHVLSALRVMAGGSPISSLFCKLVNRMEIETADFCDHENLASLFRFFSTNFTLSVKTLTDSTAKVRT
jgi:hypothetical protein